MSAAQPPRLFGTTNELAKERNRAAAQRTMNAWVGNCLSLIGVGVAIDQITRSLQQRFPADDPVRLQAIAEITGLALVGIGVGLLGFALIQHRLEVKTIEREDYVLSSIGALNRVVVAAIVLSGFVGFFTVCFLV
jgi:putative membrane protein